MRPITAIDLQQLYEFVHKHGLYDERKHDIVAKTLNDLTGLAFLKDNDTFKPSTYLSSNGRVKGYDTIVCDQTCGSISNRTGRYVPMAEGWDIYWGNLGGTSDCGSEGV